MARLVTLRNALKAVDRALPWDRLYRGDRLECPCCGGRFRKFRKQSGRPDARCPRCQSLERHRVQWLYLRHRTDLFEAPHELLHFAAEPALEPKLLAMPNLRYVSADLYPKNEHQVKVDITDMPFDDASFDLCLCNHVFGEVPDDRAAMREVFRVLRPGGRLISQTAWDPDLAETVEDAPSAAHGWVPRGGDQAVGANIRRYGRDFEDRLREAGFEVEVVRYVEELDPATVERHALRETRGQTRGSDIWISVKPGR
jgi:SAM-dependent methyltransferase